MGFYGYGWPAYVPAAERRKKAEKAAAKAKKAGTNWSPIEPYRGVIAKTFWGKAWCDNLEAYSDYQNRLPRGATYVRNGSVVDLNIAQGKVQAKVMGTSLYKVKVDVAAVPAPKWQAIGKDCSGSIDSLVELLQGKLSTAVMQRICTPKTGLFPAPSEIEFDCSCPDWAGMCKHVAAVLYGVGKRLDERPELLFFLRGVDAKDLVGQASAELTIPRNGIAAGKVLDEAALADVFGFEMDEGVAERKVAVKKPTVRKTAAQQKAQPKTPLAAPAKPAIRQPAGKKTAPKAKTPKSSPPLPPLKTKSKPTAKVKPQKIG